MSFIMDKLKEIKQRHSEAEDLKEGVEDKPLISLRNARQRQMNEIEKKVLRRQIKDFEKARFRKLMGMKKKPTKKLAASDFNLLKDKKPILKQKRIL